jgi:hypothetical protein
MSHEPVTIAINTALAPTHHHLWSPCDDDAEERSGEDRRGDKRQADEGRQTLAPDDIWLWFVRSTTRIADSAANPVLGGCTNVVGAS